VRDYVRSAPFGTAAAVFAALCLLSTNVLAISYNHDGTVRWRTRPAHVMTHHREYTAHRQIAHGSREGAPVVPAYRWPGHEFVPRYGTADPACNLPTSGCPNEMRDVQ
jgi:hypothetical protein